MDAIAILRPVTIAITGLGFLTNALVLLGLQLSRRVRSHADLALNSSQAVSDLLLCVTYASFQIYLYTSGFTLNASPMLCNGQGALIYLFIAVSVFTLLSVASFHWATIVWEKGLASQTQVGLVVTGIWVIGLIGSMFTYGWLGVSNSFVKQPSGMYCLNDFTNQTPIIKVFNACIVVILFTTPIFLAVIYYSIWAKLHVFQLYVQNRAGGSKSNSGGNGTVNVNKMIVRRACAVSSSFAFVYYLIACLFAYQVFTGDQVSPLMDAIGITVVSLETLVNPLLVLFLDARCRSALFGGSAQVDAEGGSRMSKISQ